MFKHGFRVVNVVNNNLLQPQTPKKEPLEALRFPKGRHKQGTFKRAASSWIAGINTNECECVSGVTVLKGQEEIEVHAPVVISNAGIFNTFQKFLPQQIQEKPGNVVCGLVVNCSHATSNCYFFSFVMFFDCVFHVTCLCEQRSSHCWVWYVMVWVLSWSLLVLMELKRSWTLFQATSGCIKTMTWTRCRFLKIFSIFQTI